MVPAAVDLRPLVSGVRAVVHGEPPAVGVVLPLAPTGLAAQVAHFDGHRGLQPVGSSSGNDGGTSLVGEQAGNLIGRNQLAGCAQVNVSRVINFPRFHAHHRRVGRTPGHRHIHGTGSLEGIEGTVAVRRTSQHGHKIRLAVCLHRFGGFGRLQLLAVPLHEGDAVALQHVEEVHRVAVGTCRSLHRHAEAVPVGVRAEAARFTFLLMM